MARMNKASGAAISLRQRCVGPSLLQLAVFGVAATCCAVPGCSPTGPVRSSSNASGNSPSASGSALAASSPLDRPIFLFREGKAQEAVLALGSTNWSDPTARFDSPLLTMTEREFVALPRVDQDRVRTDAVHETNDVRALVRAAFSHSQALADAGRKKDAVSLLQSVQAFGARLAEPGKQLDLVRIVGESIEKKTAEKLDGLR